MAELQTAIRRSIIGEVISVKSISKDDFPKDKFKHDCKIVTVDPLNGNPLVTIYITVGQFAKYEVSEIVFPGNVVNFSIDDNVAGETGYMDATTKEWEIHTKSFSAFAGVNNVGSIGLIGVFGKQGVGADMVLDFIKAIEASRAKHAALGKKTTVVACAEDDVAEDAPED